MLDNVVVGPRRDLVNLLFCSVICMDLYMRDDISMFASFLVGQWSRKLHGGVTNSIIRIEFYVTLIR